MHLESLQPFYKTKQRIRGYIVLNCTSKIKYVTVDCYFCVAASQCGHTYRLLTGIWKNIQIKHRPGLNWKSGKKKANINMHKNTHITSWPKPQPLHFTTDLPWKVVDSYPVLVDGYASWDQPYENLCVALILKAKTKGQSKTQDYSVFSKLCGAVLHFPHK